MPFYFVILGFDLLCAVHVVKTRRPLYWVFIILAIPAFGSLVYFIAEMLPDLLHSREARQAVHGARKAIDPERDYRALAEQFDTVDTVANRQALAEECLRLGKTEQAITLYQGALAGSATVSAIDMSFATRQKLTGVDVGPLLRDAADLDILEGRGTVSLDVATTGRTVTALKKGLAGTADLALKDGAIKGVDIPGIIRVASTLLGSKGGVEQSTQGSARTEFTELTASFKIAHGVAHNEDLLMKSPVLRLTGRGDIDIGEDKIDYTAKAAIVAPPGGQPKELAQLAGVTVPVRAIGPIGSPKYIVDVQVLATELAKSQLGRELERRLGGGKSGGQSGSSGIDALGDALRGLFGKPK